MRKRGRSFPFHQDFLAVFGKTQSSRALAASELPSTPGTPCRTGAVWAPAVPMTTADYAARDSLGAGGCAHLRVRAGESRAVPARSLGAGGNTLGAAGGNKASSRWGRRPGSGEEPGQRSGSPSSTASPQLGAPLPPVNR